MWDDRRLPIAVFSGLSRAGKATLLDCLPADREGQRLAVIVDDPGKVIIEADLMRGAEARVAQAA